MALGAYRKKVAWLGSGLELANPNPSPNPHPHPNPSPSPNINRNLNPNPNPYPNQVASRQRKVRGGRRQARGRSEVGEVGA